MHANKATIINCQNLTLKVLPKKCNRSASH